MRTKKMSVQPRVARRAYSLGRVGMMRFRGALLLFAIAGLLGACSTAPYTYEPRGSSILEQRAEAQAAGGFGVRAAVPGVEEAEAFFGVNVYERDIQPVWIEIRNDNDVRARVAISSVDPKYFPPAEVAWFFKKAFSKQGWMDLEKRLKKFHEDHGSS